MSAVGQAVPHDSSTGHVTGQAQFLADVPEFANELCVDFVGSPIAKGRLLSVDCSAALRVPGIVGLFTARDLTGHNRFGPVRKDEAFLVERECTYLGEPIVVIAGGTLAAVREAGKAVRIEVERGKPILTIDEAVDANAFLTPRKEFRVGDVEAALQSAEYTLSGVLHIGGQEHFYLESQAALACPGEDGQMTVYSSTQNPTEIQHVVADVLGLGMHQVVCICKRMGGGFGGKETQAALPALMAALVAMKTGRPARILYSKAADMRFTGKRHPYQARYTVGFTKDGDILGLKMDYYSNGGASTDLSASVMDRTLFHTDNAYYLPNAAISGRVCRTNLPSNTAFRGFGGPQAVAAIEAVVEEIAQFLGKDACAVRLRNLYGVETRNRTHYGQTVTNNVLPRLLQKLIESSSYRARREAVRAFNTRSQTQRKGISLTPVKFGISFTTTFLNQGSALVNVYTDGSVQVSTGGTEMGQGLNTKIRQLAADVFGLPLDRVLVMPASTEKNNNTSPTAASASTDLNGAAAVRACERIRERMAAVGANFLVEESAGLHPAPEEMVFEEGVVYDRRRPEVRVAFAEIAGRARRGRVDLGERAFFATPDIHFDPETNQGSPFAYYTNGAAVSEVTIDLWSGALTVDRVDLLMDIGESINPGIDKGQVVGGFVQGMGWVTTEELKYSPDGDLLSCSPTTYKIPGSLEVPARFHVAFVENPENRGNIRGSKAVGEPPLLLGISVWTAVKHALSFACDGQIPALALPATGEEILRCLTLAKPKSPDEAPIGNGRDGSREAHPATARVRQTASPRAARR